MFSWLVIIIILIVVITWATSQWFSITFRLGITILVIAIATVHNALSLLLYDLIVLYLIL